jgi:hypothetical protein
MAFLKENYEKIFQIKLLKNRPQSRFLRKIKLQNKVIIKSCFFHFSTKKKKSIKKNCAFKENVYALLNMKIIIFINWTHTQKMPKTEGII